MLRVNSGWRMGLLAAGLAVAGASSAGADLVIDKNTQESGSTLPYAQTEIAFKYQGVVKDVFVKEGDHVDKDQPLMGQDTAEDQIEYQADLSVAKSTAAIDSAKAALVARKADVKAKQADLAAKTKEYERVKKVLDSGGSNNWEVDKAQDEMESAAASVDEARAMGDSAAADIAKAQLEQEQAQYKADHQKAHLGQMVRKSPIKAIVLSVTIEPGETVDPAKNTGITLVEIDTLKVEFFLPAIQAQKLALKQKLKVSYDGTSWKDAEVSFKAPVALAGAGGLQKIHLLLDNKDDLKAAGQSVVIQLPADIVAMRKSAVAAAESSK